jgi:hypothetical protein
MKFTLLDYMVSLSLEMTVEVIKAVINHKTTSKLTNFLFNFKANTALESENATIKCTTLTLFPVH